MAINHYYEGCVNEMYTYRKMCQIKTRTMKHLYNEQLLYCLQSKTANGHITYALETKKSPELREDFQA